MKIMYHGNEIATITTNRSMTIEEALYAHGYDVNDPDDLQKAYNDGFEASYIDDDGKPQIDIDELTMEY